MDFSDTSFRDNRRQRFLLDKADKQTGALWDHIGEVIRSAKLAGHDHHAISKMIDPLVGPLQRITASSGRDENAISAQLAGMMAAPVEKPQEQWSYSQQAQQAGDDIDRFTRALGIAYHPDLQAALADRLTQALQQKT